MMSSMEFELFLDTFSPLQYLCLCQPDRMTEGWDSNFFGFLRTTFLCKKDWYRNFDVGGSSFVSPLTARLNLALFAALRYATTEWNPLKLCYAQVYRICQKPCCWSRLQSFPLLPQHCCYFPSLPPIPHIWDISVFNYSTQILYLGHTSLNYWAPMQRFFAQMFLHLFQKKRFNPHYLRSRKS